MFDLLTSDYPLPHHQAAEFQTKDLAHLVHGEPGECGFLDHYRITEDGRIYTRDDQSGGDRAERVEFRVRFTHGRLERIDPVELRRAGVAETT
jgi:hypothetical protein